MGIRRAIVGRETVVVLVATLVGAGLRFASFGQLGLTHFDEGIYALSGLWAVSTEGIASLDASVVPYAPPAFPVLIGLSYRFFGVGDASAILVAILAGTATIPVAGWIGRRAFGEGAGGAAAIAAALSMPHVDFSRKALTDAPFLLAWLLATGLGARFLERPGLSRAVAMGVGVGLAQHFKYNGWLAGAIVVVAAAFALMTDPASRTRRHLARTWGFGILAAAIAFAVYWPWFSFVERHGGYGALLHHHRGYMGGPGSWGAYWNQQMGQAVALSGGSLLGALTWVVMCVAIVVMRDRRSSETGVSTATWVRGPAVLIVGAGMLAGIPTLPWWVGIPLVPALLSSRNAWALTVGASWLVFSVLTPLYHPYARLWLPLHAVGWLLLAGLLVEGSRLVQGVPTAIVDWTAWSRARRRGTFAGLAVLVAIAAWQRLDSGARAFPWRRHFVATSDFRNGVAGLPTHLPAPGEMQGGLTVLARRPLLFYLLLQGRYPFGLAANADGVLEPGRDRSWAIVDGALIRQEANSGAILNRLKSRGAKVLWTEFPDPITLLDIDPGSAFGAGSTAGVDMWLIAPKGREAPGSRTGPR